MELIAPVAVGGIFTGRVGLLPGESRGSAIAKVACTGPCRIGTEGFVGDEHADLRAHGGAEKAVHLLPVEHYEALARAFPEARHVVPGGLGENLSTRGLTEDVVCIGDIFTLGTVRLQVSQPRTPCWKIDARCGVEGVAAHVAEHGIAGWYFRVLTPGECAAGDLLIHVERPPGAINLAKFNRAMLAHRPALDLLKRMAAAPGLNLEWARRIRDRLARLASHGENP